MRYLSLFSGIEAASVAFAPLGWEPLAFAEIDSFCCAVLQHHYPDVPNLGDVTTLQWSTDDGAIDLLIGGSPCQSFSVAGQRGGLGDPRGDLTLTYFALVDRLRPRWVVWENVPGVLSDDSGRTFGTILWLLGECGYGFAYRVLDAQYAGVPQCRRRVFVVGYLGDWRPPAAVLFERHSLSGHSPPRRHARESVAACLTQGVDSQGKGGYAGRRREDDVNLVIGALSSTQVGISGANEAQASAGHLVAFHPKASAQRSMNPKPIAPTLDRSKVAAICFDTTQITSPDNRSQPQPGGPCHPLTSQGHAPSIAYACNAKGGSGRLDAESETFVTYSTSGQSTWRKDAPSLNCTEVHAVTDSAQVRRLSPRECERLQGFPDDWTLVPYRGKLAKDGPRYRAIGNSMAVPVVSWIGKRIQLVKNILNT